MKHTMANYLVKYSDEGYPIKSPEDGVKLNDKFYNQIVNLNSINIVIILKINC